MEILVSCVQLKQVPPVKKAQTSAIFQFLRSGAALLHVDSPDYILINPKVSANGMEMEILHGSSWLGPREEYTKYLASSLNLVSMEMRTSCLAGRPAPMLLLII